MKIMKVVHVVLVDEIKLTFTWKFSKLKLFWYQYHSIRWLSEGTVLCPLPWRVGRAHCCLSHAYLSSSFSVSPSSSAPPPIAGSGGSGVVCGRVDHPHRHSSVEETKHQVHFQDNQSHNYTYTRKPKTPLLYNCSLVCTNKRLSVGVRHQWEASTIQVR